jgi:hypothetical protein
LETATARFTLPVGFAGRFAVRVIRPLPDFSSIEKR